MTSRFFSNWRNVLQNFILSRKKILLEFHWCYCTRWKIFFYKFQWQQNICWKKIMVTCLVHILRHIAKSCHKDQCNMSWTMLTRDIFLCMVCMFSVSLAEDGDECKVIPHIKNNMASTHHGCTNASCVAMATLCPMKALEIFIQVLQWKHFALVSDSEERKWDFPLCPLFIKIIASLHTWICF